MSDEIAQGEYLTDGKNLIFVLVVLPDGRVLVEDVRTNESVEMEAQALGNGWHTPRAWAERKVAV